MSLTPAQVHAALAVQHAAAHDPGRHVRVVAGPGTGKSSAIEERPQCGQHTLSACFRCTPTILAAGHPDPKTT